MKNINIKTFSLLVLVFSAIGCSDYLNEEPQGLINPDVFIVSAENAEAVLLSAYANLKYHPDRTDQGLHYWRGIWHFSELPTDDFADSNRRFPPSIYTTDATYGVLSRTWEELYSVINRTNTLISRLPELEGFSDSEKNEILGEAYFLRAFMYWKLVRHWGGVPLKLEEVTSLNEVDAPRATELEVYEQIEDDLLFAIANAPDDHSGSKSRATKNSARALMSKVYLQWAGQPLNDASKWQMAADMASQVTGSLLTDYGQIFSTRNEGNDEVIFDLPGTTGLGVWHPTQGNLLTAVTRADQEYRPSTDLLNAFDNDDLRLQMLNDAYVSEGDTIATFIHPIFLKWYDIETIESGVSVWDSNTNYIFLRYADIVLVEAEALNEVGYGNSTAFARLNEIRSRAGLSDLTTADLPDQSSFRDQVILERRRELYFEESRLFDLVRHGKAVSTIAAFADNEDDYERANGTILSGTFPSDRVTLERMKLPIPQTEIDNNLELSQADQNPGY